MIYVGETADRIGFRCFDPESYTFSTEFELTFDEQSGRKRMNALREHDIRRELQRRSQLEDLPLIKNEYAPENNELKTMTRARAIAAEPDPTAAGGNAAVSPSQERRRSSFGGLFSSGGGGGTSEKASPQATKVLADARPELKKKKSFLRVPKVFKKKKPEVQARKKSRRTTKATPGEGKVGVYR